MEVAITSNHGRPAMQGIRIYGADWCHDTRHTLQHLQQLGIDFTYVNVDTDQHAKHWVRQHNEGKQILPTLEISGRVLSIPNDRELDRVLKEEGMIS